MSEDHCAVYLGMYKCQEGIICIRAMVGVMKSSVSLVLKKIKVKRQ